MEKINRRDFLKLVGAGSVGTGAGVLFAESTKMSVELLMPQVVPPEDYSPGVATWYNSICGQCGAGCGITVRTREGRAKKIEGNPLHPVNQGGLCALGQAGLNALYNPDRLQVPLKRAGERGSGAYTEISWDEALTTLSGRLSALRIASRGSQLCLLSGQAPGHLDHLFEAFMQGIGSDNYLLYDFLHPGNLYAATRAAFSQEQLPYYDIGNAGYLLSFGADYLGTWLSPVHHGLNYGQMRQGGQRPRGHCVQVEPRMSISGANADEWVPARPGCEGLLALAIAHEIVHHLGYNGVDRDRWVAALSSYEPSAVAERCGVEAGTIQRLAREFVSHERSLAIGGGAASAGTNGVATLLAVQSLNYLVGNLNVEGGVLANPAPMFANEAAGRHVEYADIEALAQRMANREFDTLIVHACNPLHTLPTASAFAKSLAGVPFIVALSSFMDETTAMADLILPIDTYLESWGDGVPQPGVGLPVAAVAQPVVTRLYNTLAAGDIVLQVGHQIGGDLPVSLPWGTYEEYIRGSLKTIYAAKTGDGSEEGFSQFWHEVLKSGVWAETGGQVVRAELSCRDLPGQLAGVEPVYSGDDTEYPYFLQPYMTPAFADGRGANLPWMQELPDPLTSIVYHTWVELNPVTARALGVEEGDVVAIESTAGTVEVPVFVYPAIRPDVVAVPIGQGHTEYGRYARQRGSNPLAIVAPQVDATSGALAWGASRVRLRATGKRIKLPRTDGVTRTLGRQILVKDHPHTPEYM